MTDDDNGKCGAPLPMLIELSNPFPREPKMMRKRLYPAVLRFNKPKRDNNPYEYMLNELMLCFTDPLEKNTLWIVCLYG